MNNSNNGFFDDDIDDNDPLGDTFKFDLAAVEKAFGKTSGAGSNFGHPNISDSSSVEIKNAINSSNVSVNKGAGFDGTPPNVGTSDSASFDGTPPDVGASNSASFDGTPPDVSTNKDSQSQVSAVADDTDKTEDGSTPTDGKITKESQALLDSVKGISKKKRLALEKDFAHYDSKKAQPRKTGLAYFTLVFSLLVPLLTIIFALCPIYSISYELGGITLMKDSISFFDLFTASQITLVLPISSGSLPFYSILLAFYLIILALSLISLIVALSNIVRYNRNTVRTLCNLQIPLFIISEFLFLGASSIMFNAHGDATSRYLGYVAVVLVNVVGFIGCLILRSIQKKKAATNTNYYIKEYSVRFTEKTAFKVFATILVILMALIGIRNAVGTILAGRGNNGSDDNEGNDKSNAIVLPIDSTKSYTTPSNKSKYFAINTLEDYVYTVTYNCTSSDYTYMEFKVENNQNDELFSERAATSTSYEFSGDNTTYYAIVTNSSGYSVPYTLRVTREQVKKGTSVDEPIELALDTLLEDQSLAAGEKLYYSVDSGSYSTTLGELIILSDNTTNCLSYSLYDYSTKALDQSESPLYYYEANLISDTDISKTIICIENTSTSMSVDYDIQVNTYRSGSSVSNSSLIKTMDKVKYIRSTNLTTLYYTFKSENAEDNFRIEIDDEATYKSVTVNGIEYTVRDFIFYNEDKTGDITVRVERADTNVSNNKFSIRISKPEGSSENPVKIHFNTTYKLSVRDYFLTFDIIDEALNNSYALNIKGVDGSMSVYTYAGMDDPASSPYAEESAFGIVELNFDPTANNETSKKIRLLSRGGGWFCSIEFELIVLPDSADRRVNITQTSSSNDINDYVRIPVVNETSSDVVWHFRYTFTNSSPRYFHYSNLPVDMACEYQYSFSSSANSVTLSSGTSSNKYLSFTNSSIASGSFVDIRITVPANTPLFVFSYVVSRSSSSFYDSLAIDTRYGIVPETIYSIEIENNTDITQYRWFYISSSNELEYIRYQDQPCTLKISAYSSSDQSTLYTSAALPNTRGSSVAEFSLSSTNNYYLRLEIPPQVSKTTFTFSLERFRIS